MKLSLLASIVWWKAAAVRALYTAITLAIPYLGGSLLADVPWLTIGSVAGLGFVASLVTSLAGLPESQGVDLPWWLAATERTVKTFAQALGSGFVGATLLTDVQWGVVMQFALLSALGSLLRLILATLPNDPTPKAAAVEYITIGDVHLTDSGSVHVDDVATDAAAARRSVRDMLDG